MVANTSVVRDWTWIWISTGACLLAISPSTISQDASVAADKSAVTQVASFQNGVDGYELAVDTEIWALAPTTILESNPNASSDANNDGGESQVLLRFDGIIKNHGLYRLKIFTATNNRPKPQPPKTL